MIKLIKNKSISSFVIVFTCICVLMVALFTGCTFGKAAGGDTENKTSQTMESFSKNVSIEEETSSLNVETTGTLKKSTYNSVVSYAGWSEGGEIKSKALNAAELSDKNSLHLPVYKFDTLEELEHFKTEFLDVYAMESGYGQISSFNVVTKKYDEKYFEHGSLVLVYVGTGTGSYRFGLKYISCYESNFCVYVEYTYKPEAVTFDMSGWFIVVEVPDNELNGYTNFDAFLEK